MYSAGQSAQLPVAIDYPAALALRQMSMVHDELPKYLLAPEVSALLHYVPDLRRMLLATLWNTGARINEALALTRGFFAHASVSVCAACDPETTDRKSCGTAGECPPVSRLTGWFRSLTLVRQPAADDGGNTENTHGAA
ncbi:hypothetical protein BANRA_05074 [Escherichia coli]|nr:hypothetical protein BANRA_05074 [Escherichia coli]